MNPLKKRWLIDGLIICFAACLFLPVFILNAQYERAHVAADKALREARDETSGSLDLGKYNKILGNKARNLASPEACYQKRDIVARITLWLFSIPLIGSIVYRRWYTLTLVFLFWILTSFFHGLRI